MINPRTPVLVGSGQITQKIDNLSGAKDPIDLMRDSSVLAINDTTVSDLSNHIDSVVTVRFIFDSGAGARPPFSIFKNPPKSLADRLGIEGAKTFYGPTGGNTPQYLVNIMAEKISQGESDVVLLSGSECFSSMRKASKQGVKTGWGEDSGGKRIDLGFEKAGGTDNEIKHGITLPVNVYPLFETAIRGRMGHSIEKHQNYLGELFSPFTKIAKEHPNAWFPIERSAAEISTANKANRYISYPYTKYMNAIMEVDQASSLIIMSEEKANHFSIPKEKRIYLHGCGDINEVWNVTERPKLHTSKAIRLMGEKAFGMSGWNIDQIDYLDLYSCFPSMVELGREALDIGMKDSRDLTVTGGLPYFGGAGNNYVTHSIATLMDKLREKPGSKGLCTSNGWFATKHGIGLYSSEPYEGDWKREDPKNYQKDIDLMTKPEVDEKPSGDGKIETYTVAYGREGPELGIVIGRLNSSNARFIAVTQKDSDLDTLISQECLERDCSVQQFEGDYSIVNIK